jgi:hypothetical protein
MRGTSLGDSHPTPPVSSLRAALGSEAVFESRQNRFRTNPRDPLDKYTVAVMPQVHDARPSTNFELIEPEVFDEWETFPNMKLVAIPFGIKTRDNVDYTNVRNLIFAAVKEIINAERLGVSAPVPNKHAKRTKEMPTTFLISDLTELGTQTLLQRGVWSSADITFRVTTLELSRPNFLFALVDLSVTETEPVREAILKKCQEDHAQTFFQLIPQDMVTDDRLTPDTNTADFIHSISVTRLDVKMKGDKVKPRFNVYADSKHIRNPNAWSQVRDFLAGQIYESTRIGKGKTIIAPNDCGICHSADHPRGLCPFPDLPGWNGPAHSVGFRRNRDSINRGDMPNFPSGGWN